MLNEMIYPDYKGENGWPLHHEGKENYVWNTGDPF